MPEIEEYWLDSSPVAHYIIASNQRDTFYMSYSFSISFIDPDTNNQ